MKVNIFLSFIDKNILTIVFRCIIMSVTRLGGIFMRKNSFVHYLTKVLVDVMFYGGILCCIALPFVMPRLVYGFAYHERAFAISLNAILLPAGLCVVYILWQLKAMFKTLLGGNPFVTENVSSLRKCAVASFLIAIIFAGKMIFAFSVMMVVAVLIFSLLGLFCLTLKDLFKQAVAYKEENDWTV